MNRLLLAIIFSTVCCHAFAQSPITNTNLDALMSMEVEVTSAMKRAQPIKDTPASIFVLTRKDIAMSGYSTITELMKLLPGLDVRRINNHFWAVSVRSASGFLNSNILVLLDGKNLSEPGFNGVYWGLINYPVADIERIEFIKGNSGGIWGNVSSNGLVNIITRHTADTNGASLTIGFGNEMHQTRRASYSDYLSEQLSYRLYYNSSKTGTSNDITFNEQVFLAFDRQNQSSLGAQFNYHYSDDLALKAHYYHNKTTLRQLAVGIELFSFAKTYFPDYTDITSNSFDVRLDHHISDDLKYYIQTYYSDFEQISNFRSEDYKKFSINTAANYLSKQHLFSWGFDYSYNHRKVNYAQIIHKFFAPATTYGGFLQDQYNINDSLKVIAGIRFDHYFQHGWLTSPNLRFLYHWSPQSTLWLSLAKGTRVATHYNKEQADSFEMPTIIPNKRIVIHWDAKDLFDKQRSIELGYRYHKNDFNFDLTAFSIEHLKRFNLELNLLSIVSSGDLIVDIKNSGSGDSSGVEATANWQLNQEYHLLLGYSYVDYNVDPHTWYQLPAGGTAYHIAQIYSRLQYQINEQVSLQLLAKRISKNRSYGSDFYSKVDLSLHWQPTANFKLSLIGENLTNSNLIEIPNDTELTIAATGLGQRVMLKANYNF